MMDDDRSAAEIRSTGVHEAGHAVIALVLEIDVDFATIDVDGHSWGRVSHTQQPETLAAQWWENGKYGRSSCTALHANILVAMAGRRAEQEILGTVISPGIGQDEEQIADLMLSLVGPYDDDNRALWDRVEDRLLRMMRMLVRRHRTRIEAVADALEGRRTLSGEEIVAIIYE